MARDAGLAILFPVYRTLVMMSTTQSYTPYRLTRENSEMGTLGKIAVIRFFLLLLLLLVFNIRDM